MLTRRQIDALEPNDLLAEYGPNTFRIEDEDGDQTDDVYETRDAAAGACQDAQREDGRAYTVREVNADPRCGYSDDELDQIRRTLALRGLVLVAGFYGLRVERGEQSEEPRIGGGR